MSPEIRFRLEDMKRFAEKRFAEEAIHFLGDRSASDVAQERMRELALARLVELVEEAAARVPEETRHDHPELPWRQAVGLRNILIHGYGQIRMDIVVRTVRQEFPPMISGLRRILGGETA